TRCSRERDSRPSTPSRSTRPRHVRSRRSLDEHNFETHRVVVTDVLRAAAPLSPTIASPPLRNALPAHRLSTLLLRTAKAMEARIESAPARHGLSMAKWGVLRQLADEQRPLPLTRIAERVSCVKSNVTQLVDRLEADALVVRVDAPSDRRSVRAMIT